MEEKVFRDTRTQIGILKSRGIIIKNKKRAKQIIIKTNYYNLINGYKEPFLQTATPYEKYLSGTRLEEIYALYEFDRNLRLITLEYILEFEKQVKSLVAFEFSKEYGYKNYLNMENFDIRGTKKYEQTCKLLSNLYKKITLNIKNDLSISHYVNGKNYIPLWVLVNAISMGDISKFYSNMLQHNQDDIAKRVKWGIRDHQLANCLFFLSTIRNRCAHDELLYSYSSYSYLSNNNYFKYFNKTKNTNDYFSVMVAFKLVFPNKRYMSYFDQIDLLYSELSSKLTTIPIKKIRNMMGLPSNWRSLGPLQ